MTVLPLARDLLPVVRDLTREAGAIALDDFRLGAPTAARIWSKSGGSPVTGADVAVDAFLKVRLSQLLPEAGWLSEETADDPARLGRRLVWIVDPIDGTRAFIAGHPDWSVAVALLDADRPVIGVVFAAAHGALYEAQDGAGARRNGDPIRVSALETLRGARVAGPKPQVERLERRAGPVERVTRIPSLALRLVRVAEGAVDAGLVSSDSRDWDLAAADLILAEAGGQLSDLEGGPLRYNRPDPVHGELLAASRRLHPALIEAMTAHRHPAAAGR